MCGRFALAVKPDENQLAFPTFIFPDNMPLRYNIAPGQNITAIANTDENHAHAFKWGLIPSWAKDPKIGNRLINARSETLAEKPSFRSAYKKRRCLIPTTGFYEWQRNPDGKTKTPMHIALKSGTPFVFAGLWESWHSPEGDHIRSCTIITTEPNDLMAPIHNRMPVILPTEHYDTWLDPSDRTDLQELLEPFPDAEMTAHPVSTLVNSPTNDTSECLEPAQPPEQGALF
jgi:putative SOS response-associated peptidase YedK